MLAPERVSVPAPCFTKAPLPEITPLMAPFPCSSTVSWKPALLMAAALKLVAVKLVAALRVIASPNWMAPLVSIGPPATSKVPGLSVVIEAAVTAALNQVWPLLFTMRSPKAPLAPVPTAPVKVAAPEPVEAVRLRWLESRFSVLSKLRFPPPVLTTTSALRVTASLNLA